jgi:hypothetical protein
MRAWIALILAGLLCSSGCTHLALERRTVNQASTVADLQYQQVLDNLAMFACNPDALAWHLKLTAGTIQVSDQGTGTLAVTATSTKFPVWVPAGTAQRGAVHQWSGAPTVDPDTLELLQVAYRKALQPEDSDGAIQKELFYRIGELSIRFNVVLSKEVLNGVIIHNPHLSEARKWQLQKKNDELHEQLDKVFDQLAKLSRPFSDTQIDDYAKKLYDKAVTNETRGEALVKLQAQQQQQRPSVQYLRIGVEDQIVKLTRDAYDLPYVPRYPATGRAEHNLRATEQAQRQIKVLYELATLEEYALPWVCVAHGHPHAPHGAYKGHWRWQCHESHIWVPRDRQATLRNFTLAILTLAPIEGQESASGASSGQVTFSPTIGGPR